MLGWLWRLVVGRFSQCDHVFEIIDKRLVESSLGGRFLRYNLRCTKCGDVFKRDLE